MFETFGIQRRLPQTGRITGNGGTDGGRQQDGGAKGGNGGRLHADTLQAEKGKPHCNPFSDGLFHRRANSAIIAAIFISQPRTIDMGFLQGKKILITGMISERSIAYGIAKACREQGAELAFTYVVDKLEERVRKMAEELGSQLVFRCDVQSDAEIEQLFTDLGKSWDGLDGLVHAIAFAPREALNGDFLDSISREAFNTAHDVSAYSLPALVKAARPMMKGRNSAVVALSYLGAVRAIPNYNVMGLAKASLEAAIRFTASSVGRDGIRCNGISAGPIKTLAASGIADFSKLLKHVADQNPLGRNVTIEEVGNAAAFLLSDLASGITGEITYVDGGYSINALSEV